MKAAAFSIAPLDNLLLKPATLYRIESGVTERSARVGRLRANPEMIDADYFVESGFILSRHFRSVTNVTAMNVDTRIHLHVYPMQTTFAMTA